VSLDWDGSLSGQTPIQTEGSLMSDSIKLSSVAVDCPNARELAAFYAAITGGQVTYQSDVWDDIPSRLCHRRRRLPAETVTQTDGRSPVCRRSIACRQD
jgi:hypothetical protein